MYNMYMTLPSLYTHINFIDRNRDFLAYFPYFENKRKEAYGIYLLFVYLFVSVHLVCYPLNSR
jgi:hypothetical protein